MTAFETTAGTDVALHLTPDTPAGWQRIPPGTLAAIDQLADTLHAPGWRITVQLGPSSTLTAEPAPEAAQTDEQALPDPAPTPDHS